MNVDSGSPPIKLGNSFAFWLVGKERTSCEGSGM